MLNGRWIAAVCLVVLAVQGFADSAIQASGYQVSEVVRVISPVSFQCKLANYTPSSTVRFTVRIRGMIPPKQGTQSDDKAFLEQVLLSADTVELRNVRFRNYFRVEADLWIDQIDAAPYLLERGWIRPSPPKQSNEPAAPTNRKRAVLPQNSARPRGVPADSVRPVVSMVNLESLLNTQVDCSLLNSETTFEEALDILAHSVNPPLPLLVMWSDLENNAFIEKNMPIGTDGFRTMRLADALDSVLRSVSFSSGVKPVVVSSGGFLTVGTAQTLIKRPTVKVYSIEDLLAAPSTANENNGQSNQTGR